jgi:hypothetical protein
MIVVASDEEDRAIWRDPVSDQHGQVSGRIESHGKTRVEVTADQRLHRLSAGKIVRVVQRCRKSEAPEGGNDLGHPQSAGRQSAVRLFADPGRLNDGCYRPPP